jgi:hypothetical protein
MASPEVVSGTYPRSLREVDCCAQEGLWRRATLSGHTVQVVLSGAVRALGKTNEIYAGGRPGHALAGRGAGGWGVSICAHQRRAAERKLRRLTGR